MIGHLRVAGFTGGGRRRFALGSTSSEWGISTAEVPAGQRVEAWNRAPGIGGITRNLEIGKPVIAAVNGVCLAAAALSSLWPATSDWRARTRRSGSPRSGGRSSPGREGRNAFRVRCRHRSRWR